MPLLSVIIPVFNASNTIERTLLSLARLPVESKEQIEVIVVDDGSADGSFLKIEAQKNSLVPMMVKIVRQNNAGSAAARNVGLNTAGGEWIFFLDADDEIMVDPIEYILSNQNYSALVFRARFWKKNKSAGVISAKKISERNFLDVFTVENPFSSSNIIFKKSSINKFFDPEFKYLEDWNFWIDNRHLFGAAIFFPKIDLIKVHIHGHNKSVNYQITGYYRAKTAQKILVEFAEMLTLKQKNNLALQTAIGQILQRQKINIKAFVFFPCSMVLYLKFLVYYFTGGSLQKYHF